MRGKTRRRRDFSCGVAFVVTEIVSVRLRDNVIENVMCDLCAASEASSEIATGCRFSCREKRVARRPVHGPRHAAYRWWHSHAWRGTTHCLAMPRWSVASLFQRKSFGRWLAGVSAARNSVYCRVPVAQRLCLRASKYRIFKCECRTRAAGREAVEGPRHAARTIVRSVHGAGCPQTACRRATRGRPGPGRLRTACWRVVSLSRRLSSQRSCQCV